MDGHETSIATPAPAAAAVPEDGGAAREKRSRRVFFAFMRGELLAPIDAMIGLSRLLREDALDLARPADFLADVELLCSSAESLYGFVDDALEAAPANPESPGLQEVLRKIRHDIGNRLVPVSAAIQFLREVEDRTFFGAFSGDLARIYAYFKECEAKLLRFRDGGPVAEDESSGTGTVWPARAGDPSGPAADASHRELSPAVGRVLIADDDPGSRDFLGRLLERHDHEVHLASDGVEALRLMHEIDFDVALIDIMMPNKNGFQVLEELKQEGYGHIPVLVISALGEMDDVVRAIRMGAHDFLPKPVNQLLVRARVNSCIEQMRLREREMCQFFTPDIARQIARRPDRIRQGTEADVSVLFCDIRGFSRICEGLVARTTVRWVSDVMNSLSECVLQHRGTLVDYVGDELMAMWGAPEPQADHALLACRAALDMQSRIPELNRRWHAELGRTMAVGIGINSGPAHVGNTGSERRFKYGPLGSTVNLASRVQGATKRLRSSILITGETRRRIDGAVPTRRLSTVRVRNIHAPVDLCELLGRSDTLALDLKDSYEQALESFEAADFRAALEILGPLVAFHPDDGPSMLLMERIIKSAMSTAAGEPFEFVCDLP